ncbi:MAG: PorT family protein [Lentimicrobiaceae bacterium]|nr:PorT family protein [Lentimicrobiaceae bacterium]
MKKILFILVILAFCGSLVAQKHQHHSHKKPPPLEEKETRKVLFGVYFGPTVDWIVPTSNELTRKAAKAGFITGLGVDINLTPKKILYFSTGAFVRYLQGEFEFTNRYKFNFNNFLVLDTLNTVRTYQTTYLAIPTGIKVRTAIAKDCVFLGSLGLYHNFRIAGKQFDHFSLPGVDDEYMITTKKVNNKDASLFAESAYVGIGFEYLLGHNTRVSAHVNYGCQFNYFNSKAENNVTHERFKSIAHSLQIVVGFLF